jgi:hypothetical protein
MKVFDLFPKVSDDEFAVRTKSGGWISLLSILLIFVIIPLGVQQLHDPGYEQSMAARTPHPSHDLLPIRINMTVAYPCQLLRVALRDSSGHHEFNARKRVLRQRLDPMLRPFTPFSDDAHPGGVFATCGRCYGGVLECCITCFDIIASLSLTGSTDLHVHQYPQCERDLHSIADGEGCRLAVSLDTELDRGAVVILAGGDTQLPTDYKNDLSFLGDSVNLSHWIDHLGFGRKFEAFSNPLDATHVVQKVNFSQFHYSLHLVKSFGETVTNQYSVSFVDREITKVVTKRTPIISFKFDSSPFVVKFRSRKKSVNQITTNIVAIIGGGFALLGIVDSTVWHFTRKRR